MAEICLNWKNVRRAFAIGSLVIGGIATGLPDLYSKIAFAIALGLSNAAIYIKAEENDGTATAK